MRLIPGLLGVGSVGRVWAPVPRSPCGSFPDPPAASGGSLGCSILLQKMPCGFVRNLPPFSSPYLQYRNGTGDDGWWSTFQYYFFSQVAGFSILKHSSSRLTCFHLFSHLSPEIETH